VRSVRTRPSSGRQLVCNDSGAAVVEAALITPVLLFVVLGIFEFGLIYRDYLTSSDATADAARSGAVQGNRTRYIQVGEGEVGVSADFSVAAALRNAMAGIPIESIERIVIFRADRPGAGAPLEQVPAVCKAGVSSAAAQCNAYDPRDAFEAVQEGDASYFLCSGSGAACGWPPQGREDGPSVWDIDYLGVYLRIERPYITGLFGDSMVLETASVQRLEAGRLDD